MSFRPPTLIIDSNYNENGSFIFALVKAVDLGIARRLRQST